MTREELLGKLKELFPEGIPDSCNEVMAREDAPFKSYQELRKIMGRSPAYTNRSNWLALIAGEKGGEVVPPKPDKDPLNLTWKLVPKNSVTDPDDRIYVEVDVSSGDIIKEEESGQYKIYLDTVNPEHAKLLNVEGPYNPDTKRIPVTFYYADEETVVPLKVLAGDASDNKMKEFTGESVTVPGNPSAKLNLIWDISDEVINSIDEYAKITVTILEGQASEVVVRLDDPDMSKYVSPGMYLGPDNPIPITVTEMPTEELVIKFHIEATDGNVIGNEFINFGTGTVTLMGKAEPPVEEPLELAFSWENSKDTLTKPGDTTNLLVGVVSGSFGENSPVLSLGGAETSVEVETYDPINKRFVLTSRYEGTITDLEIKPVVYVGGDSFNNITPLKVLKVTLPALKADWTMTPSLIGKGQSSSTEATITEGRANGFRLVPSGTYVERINVETIDDMTGKFKLTAVESHAVSTTPITVSMYATDASTKKEIFLGNKTLTIAAGG